MVELWACKFTQIFLCDKRYRLVAQKKTMQMCAHLFFETSCIIFAIVIAHESRVAPICRERKNMCYEEISFCHSGSGVCGFRL